MDHPHIALLDRFYKACQSGDSAAASGVCAASATFQIPGRSRLAGKYGCADFMAALVTRRQELSGGTWVLAVHDILTSEQHATVLYTEKLTRDGQAVEMRGVHVWRFESWKPVAWYEYPRDLYKFDEVWG